MEIFGYILEAIEVILIIAVWYNLYKYIKLHKEWRKQNK